MRRGVSAFTAAAVRRAAPRALPAMGATVAIPSLCAVPLTQAAFQGAAFRPGDWNCESCKAHNFRSRNTCFSCNAPKPQGAGGDAAAAGGGGGGGGGNASFDFKPGDWTCSCGQHNFRRRTQCMACNKPRPDGGL